MEKRIKDLTNIPSLGGVVSIPIDSTNFNKAMNIETTTLLKTVIDDADITNDYQAVTPTAIYNRYASETKAGLVKLYSDGDASGSALTPNDINAVYDTFQIKDNEPYSLYVDGVDYRVNSPGAAVVNSTYFPNVESNITTVNIKTIDLVIPIRSNSISFFLNGPGYRIDNIANGTLCSITGYAIDNGNRIAVAGYVSTPLGYTPTFTVYATAGRFSANIQIQLYLTATYSTI